MPGVLRRQDPLDRSALPLAVQHAGAADCPAVLAVALPPAAIPLFQCHTAVRGIAAAVHKPLDWFHAARQRSRPQPDPGATCHHAKPNQRFTTTPFGSDPDRFLARTTRSSRSSQITTAP